MKHVGHFMTCIHKIKVVFHFTQVIHDGSHKHLRIMHTEVFCYEFDILPSSCDPRDRLGS